MGAVTTRARENAFRSCPAQTGQPRPPAKPCPQFPDGAHRCADDRDPTHAVHTCTCAFPWVVTPFLGPDRSQP
jgi:hypothetical protein